MSDLRFEKASDAVGIFAHGVQLKDLSDQDFAAIKDAFFEHGVVFFRDQYMTPDDHVAFARRWADIDINRFFTPLDTHPEIAIVLKEPHQKSNIGGGWHTDHSYDQIPAMGSILRAIDLPETGGDTLFASMQAAYDALDQEAKDQIEPLKARHSSRHIFGAGAAEAEAVGDRFANADKATQDAIHPIALAHPETGRKCIYVNAAFTTGIVGVPDDEAQALLQQLYAHCVQPEFAYRFQWEPGSIAMWDNRSTWHWAMNDYHGQRRYMHRITLKGVPLY
ncbi:MAG: TauD/TfdA family dioxygenase [Pseudomonadota bacterium]